MAIPIKKQLAANIVGHWDFRTGSIGDQSGSGNNASFNGSPVWGNSSRGRVLNFNGVDSYLSVPHSSDFNFAGKATTLYIRFKATPTGANNYLFDHQAGGAPGSGWLGLVNSAGKFNFNHRATTTNIDIFSTNTLDDGEWHDVVVAFDATSSVSLYVDGLFDNQSTFADLLDRTEDLDIGGLNSGVSFYSGSMTELMILDTEMSAQQVSQFYTESLQEAHLNFIPEKTVLPDREDSDAKLLHWQSPLNGKAFDVSGNGRNSLTTSATSSTDSVFGTSFLLNGTNSWIETASTIDLTAVNQVSVSLWFKPYDTNVSKNLVEFSTNFNSHTNAFTLSTSGGFVTVGYRDGGGYSTKASIRAIIPGAWYHIVATYDRTQTGADIVELYINSDDVGVADLTAGTGGGFFGNHDLYIGSRAGTGSFINGVVEDIRLYEGIIESSTITRLYGEGKNKLGIYDTGQDWNVSDANVSSGAIENSKFSVVSGSWQVDDSTIDNEKVLTCTANGICSRVDDTDGGGGYGTWEFTLNKGAEGNYTYVQFIANGVQGHLLTTGLTGYACYINVTERVYVEQMTGVGTTSLLFYTAANYVANNTDYTIRITRGTNSNFTGYIKGGVYTDWTLMVAELGSNPRVGYTTYPKSQFTTLEFDSGDTIRGYRYSPIVQDPTA